MRADRDDELVRFADPAPSYHHRAWHCSGRKEKPSHGQRYQRHLDGRSPTLQPGRCPRTTAEHLINLHSGEPDAAFELTPPVAYFNSN